ncbi:hypothetical protein D3C72_1930280 [compost metagenome]
MDIGIFRNLWCINAQNSWHIHCRGPVVKIWRRLFVSDHLIYAWSARQKVLQFLIGGKNSFCTASFQDLTETRINDLIPCAPFAHHQNSFSANIHAGFKHWLCIWKRVGTPNAKLATDTQKINAGFEISIAHFMPTQIEFHHRIVAVLWIYTH